MFKRRWLHPRVLIKTIWSKFFPKIEFCHRCGIDQPVVWWAVPYVWEKACDGYNVLCPYCFDKLWYKRHKGCRAILRWGCWEDWQ